MTLFFNSIRNRILIFFIAIIVIPIVTLGLFANTVYSKAMEKRANDYAQQMLYQIQGNIEYYLQSVDNMIYYISQSPEVIQYFTDDTTLENNVEIEMKIRRLLNTYSESNSEIVGILIVNSGDKYISNELVKNNRGLFLRENWYQEAMSAPEITHYFSKPIGRNITAYSEYSADQVISISKAIRHPKTHEIVAVVLMDLQLTKFEEIIKDSYMSEDGFFYILDSNNDIVYAPVNTILYRINTQWFDEREQFIIKSIKNEIYEIVFKTSQKSGWKTVGVFSIKGILLDVLNMQSFILVISGITFVLAIIVAFIFSNTIATPVKELRGLMKEAEQGNLDVTFKEQQYDDEFGELGHSFNHMIKEIKQLIEMVYKEQRSKRKAEIDILQAQIKPHFLYNTLDTIQWMAIDYGAKDIVEIVGALTKLFRISLNKGREFIKINKEIEYIKSYMIIQKARYEDKLTYTIDYDESVLSKSIIKLTTQPIVENAIYHGIKQRRGVGKIEVHFKMCEDKLLIEVKDNGGGIEPERLEEINKMLNHENIESIASETGSGYGIYNVNTRIKMTYGSGYGLKYHSKLDEGTTVQIWLPLLDEV